MTTSRIFLSGIILIALMSWTEADAPTAASVEAIMPSYIIIHDALAKDSTDGIADAAKAIYAAAKADQTLPVELMSEAQAEIDAKDVDAVRTAFIPLSKTVIGLLDTAHVTKYAVAYCPMVKVSWAQKGNTVSNPFGADMGTCGTITKVAQ